MPETPITFHIAFGTYGARLHGDERGSVGRRHDTPGEPTIAPNRARQDFERGLTRFPPITFSDEQRRFIEALVPAICERGDWGYHMCAAGKDHVHVLVSAAVPGATVRRLLKRWLGQELSNRWQRPRGQSWWAEGGSVKWVWDPHYLRRAFDYIADQRISER